MEKSKIKMEGKFIRFHNKLGSNNEMVGIKTLFLGAVSNTNNFKWIPSCWLWEDATMVCSTMEHEGGCPFTHSMFYEHFQSTRIAMHRFWEDENKQKHSSYVRSLSHCLDFSQALYPNPETSVNRKEEKHKSGTVVYTWSPRTWKIGVRLER